MRRELKPITKDVTEYVAKVAKTEVRKYPAIYRNGKAGYFELRSVIMDELNRLGVKWYGNENRGYTDTICRAALS